MGLNKSPLLLLLCVVILVVSLVMFVIYMKPYKAKPRKPIKTIEQKPKVPQKQDQHQPQSSAEKPVEQLSVSGRWEQLKGLDGGDMHLLYATSDGTLFVSHSFSGVWRSEDGGRTWKMIKQDNFIDVHFYDMAELGNGLYAGSNKGLWFSSDGGRTWKKIPVDEDVDSGKYHIFSLTVYGGKVFFSAVLDKPYRHGKPGDSRLYYLDGGKVRKFNIPVDEEITIAARDPYLFVSSPFSGLYVFHEGSWKRILDKRTTKVYVDEDYNLYVGTIEDYWYIGTRKGNDWVWAHVTLDKSPDGSVFYFIKPDPLNKKRLWFGCGGASFYSFSGRGFSGLAFVGTACWDGHKLYDLYHKGNFAHSLVFYDGGYVNTACGKATKVAFVTQGGRNSVMKTEDGGKTWSYSHDGVYGDTINALNPIESGLLKGSLVVTAVSGTEIAQNYGDTWMEGVDFTIGRSAGGKIPGYSWRAVSPEVKVKGKYDLLISTGYPSPFKGEGVFGVDISCIKTGGKSCIEELVEGPHYDMVIMDGKLYAGNMDGGIDVLDLRTLKTSKLYVTGKDPVPFVKVFDGRIFVETYRGRYPGDGWMWIGTSGEVYVLEGEQFKKVYDKYVITFFVNNGKFLALRQGALVYKPTLDSPAVEVELPEKQYTDLAVDWDHGVIFVSTFDGGVYYTTLSEIASGKCTLKPFNDGLLTMKVRNLAYWDGYLFAGTEGNSVYRAKISVGG